MTRKLLRSELIQNWYLVVSAARLAAAHGVPWSVIHVLESASLSDRQQVLHYRTGHSQSATKSYCHEVGERLRQTYTDLLAWTPPHELTILTGFPWEEIGSQAERLAADLVVMGPHTEAGRPPGALRTVGRIGSTVEGLLGRKHVPVMMIHEHPCPPKPAFKRVLVGIDFSASCESALAFAGRLAHYDQGTVDLFHMLPIPPYPKYSRRHYETDRSAALNRLASLARQRLADLPRTCHVWGGALPHRELFKCAAKCGADAMILGSHTRETHGKWYAGSTVENVGAQASFPVFVLSQAVDAASAAKGSTAAPSLATGNHVIHGFEA